MRRQSALLWLINRVLRHTLIDHRAALEILVTSELDRTAVRAMPLDDGPLTACYRVTHNDLPPHGHRPRGRCSLYAGIDRAPGIREVRTRHRLVKNRSRVAAPTRLCGLGCFLI